MQVNLEFVIRFLGWCCVLNLSLLTLSFLTWLIFKTSILTLHHRLTGISQATLNRLYLQWLGGYKLLIIFFNIVPYLVLVNI